MGMLVVLVTMVCVGVINGQSCPISAALIAACANPDSWYGEPAKSGAWMFHVDSFESQCEHLREMFSAAECISEEAKMQLVQDAMRKGCMLTNGQMVIDSTIAERLIEKSASLCPLEHFAGPDTTPEDIGRVDSVQEEMPINSTSVRNGRFKRPPTSIPDTRVDVRYPYVKVVSMSTYPWVMAVGRSKHRRQSLHYTHCRRYLCPLDNGWMIGKGGLPKNVNGNMFGCSLTLSPGPDGQRICCPAKCWASGMFPNPRMEGRRRFEAPDARIKRCCRRKENREFICRFTHPDWNRWCNGIELIRR